MIGVEDEAVGIGEKLGLRKQVKAVKGTRNIGKKDLEVNIKLSILLTPLKGKIEKTVNDYLDENLA